MNYQNAKQITIVSFLAKHGYRTEKTLGNSAWYLSPLTKEKTASFKVDVVKNLWYCFSTGSGGTIIDLVMLLNSCIAKEALEILSVNTFSFQQQKHMNHKKEKENKYQIMDVKQLNNPVLINYLQQRKIEISIAKKYCLELHYCFNTIKPYYTIAFKNDSGGFETRNSIYKRCFNKKAITTIINSSDTLSLFEGFIDFLSYLTLKKEEVNEDFLILNSTSLVKKTQPYLQNYKTVKMFFDNDSAGNKASEFIKNQCDCRVVDCRVHYAHFNDLNEFLINLRN